MTWGRLNSSLRPARMRHGSTVARPGFTLVELLVSVTIIAVLAGVALAIVPGMLERARLAADTQKLREIALALGNYTSENHNTLPNQHDPIPGTGADSSTPDRWSFHECVDRYLGPPPPGFNPKSIYNHLRRPNSPFFTKAARPFPSFRPAYPEQPSPLAFSFNPNINHGTFWRGKMLRIPRPESIAIVGETNHAGGMMRPDQSAVFENDVETRYRVSRAGGKALYLFADFHVEALSGDRSYRYYNANPGERNIWRWW